jgi:hypothetical protein
MCLPNTYRIKIPFTLIIAIVLQLASCKKFVDVPPPSDQIISETVFNDDGTATAAVLGIYSQMMTSSNQFSSAFVTIYAGMSADEIYNYTAGLDDQFSKNELSPVNGSLLSGFWQPAYKYIYTANLSIEKLGQSKTVTPSVREKLIGEAKFIRAFCYFYLVNLFGDVPLVLSSDYRLNASLPRTASKNINDQIIADLVDAKNLLTVSYTSADKARPNKLAAAALLARVYLYNRQWTNAEQEATFVISSNQYSLPANLKTVFLKNSTETIWQLQPVATGFNTWEGNLLIPFASTATPTYLLSPSLINSFETGDLRKAAWDTVRNFSSQTLHVPYKYKIYNGSVITEYYVVLRLAEQYLIRAEARAQQNKISEASSDLDAIRNRAGLPSTSVVDQSALLLAIEKERFTELFAEWGHRWFDLKRTGRVGNVLGALKTTWQQTDTLWPIPLSQINSNPALKQNAGYN